ncbi:transglutaminase domain-containing protein [Sphingobacterium multivorum]|uniref:Transglutaminase domain-containing protein n=1 Tax=Sphingobacterium multivorum TaxID=28454 RepID=A0ABX7CV44_SPHMU|nr:transglutaminase-like domain-containing protein [Sphingobacterium multivorum]QQT55238.1 transglutaminase domain-containing protein [Sphingobacterium multivorum]
MKSHLQPVLIFLMFFIFSCKSENKIDFLYLENKFSKNAADSIRLQSLLFIKDNFDDLTSEKIIFFKDHDFDSIPYFLDTITSESSLRSIISKNKLSYHSLFVRDSKILTTEFLEQNINSAVSQWNTFPWSKQIPKDIFLNYLLPYKVLLEYPSGWRTYFQKQYQDSINKFVRNGEEDTDKVNASIIAKLYQSINYSENAFKLTKNPSLNEILAIGKGECYTLSHLFVYANRSVGIPSTIDIVPLWGSRNGSHATEVFYRKIETNPNEYTYSFKPSKGSFLNRPAKVFRFSFKKVNVWDDSIKALIEPQKSYIPEFLKSNHLLDVTDQYADVSNLKYTFLNRQSDKLAYICVFNYGQWMPLFYGRITNSRFAIFNKMSKNMLYQVGVPEGSSYKFVDRAFILDSSGKMIYSEPNTNVRIKIKIQKINEGENSWVKANSKYALSILNKKNYWEVVSVKYCETDSVLNFDKIPSNSFYRLKEIGTNHNLERIFLCKNDKIIWY